MVESIYGIKNTKTKYLSFECWGKQSDRAKTEYWSVEGKTITLGGIYWLGRWRQYIFEPSGNTVFNVQCLLEIKNFVKMLNEYHKRKSATPSEDLE